jgi:hypothetical protein
MTYFIIRDILITMIYVFYNLYKKLNKTNGQTKCLEVKNNWTEWVFINGINTVLKHNEHLKYGSGQKQS